MSATTRRKTLIFTGLMLITCLMFWWVKQPSSVVRAGKATDAAVSKLNTVIKSQDAVVERIVTGARKEVTARNEEIRKDVASLSPDAVASELVALVEQYRLERGD